MKKKVFLWVGFLAMFLLFSRIGWSYPVADSLRFPLNNYNVGPNYFGRFDLVRDNEWHLGEDSIAKADTPVYAPGNGVIKEAQTHKGYGGMYIIESTLPNGEKVCFIIPHMDFSSFTKKVGQEVKKGDYLGQIGTRLENGGWDEHFHFGVRKGAYPNNPNEYKCGDWIYSGYTKCAEVLKDWYPPTDFINTNRFSFDLSKDNYQGFTCGYDTEVARSSENGVWQVHVTGKNPGVVSPELPLFVAKNVVITFRAKILGKISSSVGYIYLRDEYGNWNHPVELGATDNIAEYKEYVVDLAWADNSGTLKFNKFSIELTAGGNGANEFWLFDWLRIGLKTANNGSGDSGSVGGGGESGTGQNGNSDNWETNVIPKVEIVNIWDRGVELRWNEPNVLGFGASVFDYSIPINFAQSMRYGCTFSGLYPDTTYSIRVISYNQKFKTDPIYIRTLPQGQGHWSTTDIPTISLNPATLMWEEMACSIEAFGILQNFCLEVPNIWYAQLRTEAHAGYDGQSCMELFNRKVEDEKRSVVRKTGLALKDDKYYVVIFYAKAENPSDGRAENAIFLHIKRNRMPNDEQGFFIFDYLTKSSTNYQEVHITSSSWKKYIFVFKTDRPDQNPMYIDFEILTGRVNGYMWFDELEIRETDEANLGNICVDESIFAK